MWLLDTWWRRLGSVRRRVRQQRPVELEATLPMQQLQLGTHQAIMLLRSLALPLTEYCRDDRFESRARLSHGEHINHGVPHDPRRRVWQANADARGSWSEKQLDLWPRRVEGPQAEQRRGGLREACAVLLPALGVWKVELPKPRLLTE